MAKLSVLIPARNEPYLVNTIEECFKQAGGDVEVVAVLEGYENGKPEGYDATVAKYPKLHTIYHHEPKGMRRNINEAAASAISRGAKYLFKLDAHCMLDEGYDVKLLADIEPDWIVVPRRKRLDVEKWQVRDDGRPDIDYHYLSFPDNPNDFGGPGLNGKVWVERARERFGKPEFDIDDEMSSQGSAWCSSVENFQRLELMDEESYGPFWNEMQECGNKIWLSGGRLAINKKTWYAHWHKGSAGRGYRMPESWLRQGASFSKRWMFNEAWARQTRPFKWLIEHFWPVPTWPANWEELIYSGPNRSKVFLTSERKETGGGESVAETCSLRIISAHYGPTGTEIDVTSTLQSKVMGDSLDLNVGNSDLDVGNPFRGIKKRLTVTYAYNGSEPVTLTKEERDWLIIGQSARYVKGARIFDEQLAEPSVKLNLPPAEVVKVEGDVITLKPTPAALNDFLIRRFQIPAHRLRGPMPIEVPTFHRNDLAQLFAELGFKHGAEIGVAEANYSEVLCKANSSLELLCVDPWHRYSANPQNKPKAKDEYAYNEAKRKLAQYPNVKLIKTYSMDAVRDVPDSSLDFVYIDGHHGFDYVMQDLIEWSKKVRSGGIISGDDFYYLDPKRWGAGPVEAVTAYAQAHKINPWFTFMGHKSVDFMWVKQ